MNAEFKLPRRVQFAETDMAGVLHYSNYLRYMEEIEHAFWRSIGLSVLHGDGPEQVSWPRVSVACEYFAPARFEDELTLVFRVTDLGPKSITYEVEFFNKETRIARGRTKAACCATKAGTFRSIPVPDYIRAKFAAAGGAA